MRDGSCSTEQYDARERSQSTILDNKVGNLVKSCDESVLVRRRYLAMRVREYGEQYLQHLCLAALSVHV